MKEKNKKRCQSTGNKYPAMTRKQALAALYELRKAYISALSYEAFCSEQSKQLQDRVLNALMVLTQAYYGEPTLTQSAFLCGCCYREYAQYSHEGKWCGDVFPLRCSSCYEQFKAESELQAVVEVLS